MVNHWCTDCEQKTLKNGTLGYSMCSLQRWWNYSTDPLSGEAPKCEILRRRVLFSTLSKDFERSSRIRIEIYLAYITLRTELVINGNVDCFCGVWNKCDFCSGRLEGDRSLKGLCHEDSYCCLRSILSWTESTIYKMLYSFQEYIKQNFIREHLNKIIRFWWYL